MRKRAVLIGVLAMLVVVGVAAAGGGFNSVKPSTYDPLHTYLAGSAWIAGIGCPTNSKVTYDGANGGANAWFPAGNGIPDVPVNTMVIDPGAPFTIYAGTDIGVYASTDGGSNWSPYTTGMPRVTVFDLTFLNQPGNRVIRAATHGRGIWERTPLTVPVKLEGIEIE